MQSRQFMKRYNLEKENESGRTDLSAMKAANHSNNQWDGYFGQWKGYL